MGTNRTLKLTTVARYLGVHRNTITRWMEEGKLPYVEVGPRKRKRILESVVKSMLRETSQASP